MKGRIILGLVPLIHKWDPELTEGNPVLSVALHGLRIHSLTIFGGNKNAMVGLN